MAHITIISSYNTLNIILICCNVIFLNYHFLKQSIRANKARANISSLSPSPIQVASIVKIKFKVNSVNRELNNDHHPRKFSSFLGNR